MNYRFAAILVLAFLIRYVNLVESPMWDWDEGANINYAQNLLRGKIQYFGYKYHFVPHPPLYLISLAGIFKFSGISMWSIRMFSVFLSLIGLLLVYKIIGRILGEGWGLFAAATYAVYPELVFWSRLGFANNMLSVFALASMYFLLEYLRDGRNKHLYAGIIVTSLCPLIEYTGFVFVLAYITIFILNGKKTVWISLILFAPTTAFILIMLLFDGEGFVNDLVNYFGLYPLALPFTFLFFVFVKKFSNGVESFFHRFYLGPKMNQGDIVLFLLLICIGVMSLDRWGFYNSTYTSVIFLLGIVGLAWIEKGIVRNIIYVYTGGFMISLLFLNRWDHMSIPLVYLLSVTPCFFLKNLKDYLGKRYQKFVFIIVLPLLFSLVVDIEGFYFKSASFAPVGDFYKLANYANSITSEDDFIVTPTYFGHLLKGNPLLVTHVLAYHGVNIAYWNRNYSAGDFSKNHSLDNIRWMIVEGETMEWLKNPRYPSGFNDFEGRYCFRLYNEANFVVRRLKPGKSFNNSMQYLIVENVEYKKGL